MSIKAIIFDYGNVISLPQDPQVLDELAKKAGADRLLFESLLWSTRKEYDRGTISVQEYYKNLFSRLAVTVDDKTMDEMITMDLESWKNINTGTTALMDDVKRAGYILGILSNIPHDFLSWARKSVPVFTLAQVGLFSCEVGLIKPEPEIYQALISRCGIEAEELVFFDDNPDNIRSAASMGIHAFLWKSPEDARRELLSLGVGL